MTRAKFRHQQGWPSCVRGTDGHVLSGQGLAGLRRSLQLRVGKCSQRRLPARPAISADARPPEVAAEDREVLAAAWPQPSPGPERGCREKVVGAFQPGQTLQFPKKGGWKAPLQRRKPKWVLDRKPVHGGSVFVLVGLGGGGWGTEETPPLVG